MSHHSQTVLAIIIKRYNYGETDRVVTLLTQEFGKITCLAKGARQLNSNKRAMMEPGSVTETHLVFTHSGWPLLTEAKAASNHCLALDLKTYRQLSEFLEILDNLFVEQELDDQIFQKILITRSLITDLQKSSKEIKLQLRQIIMALGFADPAESPYPTISAYVSALAERKLKSYEFLHV